MEEKTFKMMKNAVEYIWENLKKNINDALNEVEKEEFRWISSLNTENNKQWMVLQGLQIRVKHL